MDMGTETSVSALSFQVTPGLLTSSGAPQAAELLLAMEQP
jgi:hypothetical protein